MADNHLDHVSLSFVPFSQWNNAWANQRIGGHNPVNGPGRGTRRAGRDKKRRAGFSCSNAWVDYTCAFAEVCSRVVNIYHANTHITVFACKRPSLTAKHVDSYLAPYCSLLW